MCHIITDGSHYINATGGVHMVNDIKQATKFKLQKANNVLKYSIHPAIKGYNWRIEYAQVQNNQVKAIATEKEIEYDIVEKVTEIENFVKDLQERQLYLQRLQSEIELEIVDIEHATEFYNLNAAQGYKIYKMLHDRQNRRRDVKNEMEKIKYILNGSMRSMLLGNITKSINGLDERQYTPRVLKELFNV